MDRELRELRQGYRAEQRRLTPDPGPEEPMSETRHLDRWDCPECGFVLYVDKQTSPVDMGCPDCGETGLSTIHNFGRLER